MGAELSGYSYSPVHGTRGEIVPLSTVQGFPKENFGCHQFIWSWNGYRKSKHLFNYDMPEDTDTYLHRVARAGRFGTKGLAITFVSDETDAKILNEVQDRFEVDITELPEEIDLSSYIEGR